MAHSGPSSFGDRPANSAGLGWFQTADGVVGSVPGIFTSGPEAVGFGPRAPVAPVTPGFEAAEAYAEPAVDRPAVDGARVVEVVPATRSEFANRCVNVIVAGIALLLLAPVCVIVAFLVKLTSPGPVFYTQTRVGLDRRWNVGDGSAAHDAAAGTAEGVVGDAPDEGAAEGDSADRRLEDFGGAPFTILKFRSMRADAEAGGQAVWATKHDARITPVGHVLRKTRLDEVPQLINVLRGDMNIVGPRPERPSIVVRLREYVPQYPMRHRVRPGITGWAQINHSYDSCIEDVRTKVRYDLEYIGGQSMWLDLKIMCLTLPVMLFKRGAH